MANSAFVEAMDLCLKWLRSVARSRLMSFGNEYPILSNPTSSVLSLSNHHPHWPEPQYAPSGDRAGPPESSAPRRHSQPGSCSYLHFSLVPAWPILTPPFPGTLFWIRTLNQINSRIGIKVVCRELIQPPASSSFGPAVGIQGAGKAHPQGCLHPLGPNTAPQPRSYLG